MLGLSQAFVHSVLARVTTEQPSALGKGTAKVHRRLWNTRNEEGLQKNRERVKLLGPEGAECSAKRQ